MAEIIQGLFGVSPASLKAQQDAQFQQQNLQLAQLDPQAQRFAMLGSGGRALGQAVGGLFGAQDPAMYQAQQENTLVQETLAGLSPEQQQNPMAVHQAIFDMAQQRGLTDLANKSYANMQAAQGTALTQAKTTSEIAENVASASKSYRESLPKIEQLSNSLDKANAEGNTGLAARLQAQIAKETELSKSSIENRMVELASKKSSQGLTQQEAAELDYLDNFKTKVAREGASKTTLNNIEKSASSEIGKVLSATLPIAETAVNSLNTVNSIRDVLGNKDLFIGPTATLKSNINRIAVSMFGAEDKGSLENTRVAMQGLANLSVNARSRLRGSGAISNDEQKLISRAASGNIDDFTRKELGVLLDVVERDAKASYNDYAKKVKVLKDPDLEAFYSPPPLPTNKPNRIAKPTTAAEFFGGK